MNLNVSRATTAILLAVATTMAAPAFAQKGGGGGGGFGPGGGGEGDDRVRTTPPPVSRAAIDPYYPPSVFVDAEGGCEGFLRLAQGPAAAFWQARHEYCEKQLQN